jgi:hypothetical protein
MKYRYYIEGTEVFPRGDWAINYQRNEGQIFFRRIFEGELTFMGDDYTFITSLDCEIASFEIYCSGELFWEGQFQYPYLVKFDDDACIVVLEPEVVDEYSCIMDKYNYEYFTTNYLPVGGFIAPTYQACPPAGVLATLPNGFNLYHHFAGAGLGTDGMINDSLYFNCGGIGVKSSFLWRDNFANGDNYAAAYGTNNYVTGATNRLEYIYLFPSYNVRASVSWGGTVCDTGATGTWSWSFKDWEDFLRIAFNAYWFIDENGEFRIEHISYFDPSFANSDYTVTHDLTRVMDKGGRSFAYRRNKYEYETGRMYDQEVWEWLHFEGTEGGVAHGTDFAGVPIFYGASVGAKSAYVPGDFKEKVHGTNKFWADVVWAYGLIAAASPDSINCDGYLFCDIDTGTNIIRCETGVLGAASIQNGHCCTANLQDHYHQYDRIFLSGDMNSGNVTTFQTAQKHKLQDPIEFPLCCDEDFDPLDRVRTEIGDGEVKTATQKKNSLEVELWHEFDC